MSKGKILVVDDEPDIIQAISIRLEANGYEIASAENGEQAIQTAVREKPNLIILDIGLPDINGHIVAKRLAEYPQTQFTPIIYLTANATRQNFDKALVLGVSQFISKPFNIDDLLATIRMLMTRHHRYYC